ncbi:MAG: hypothetical protein ABEH35_07915 [Haloarculaceae archaeon]
MRVVSYVYDSDETPDHVRRVLEALDDRDESFDRVDVSEAGEREATLTVKQAVRIGSPPSELFDDDGQPDFSAGALITEAPTGRRSLHVGQAAIEALRDPQ